MATWPQWNHGIETIDVDGTFEVGTTFTMTPITEIIGEAAGQVGPELGPQITADFPEVIAALVKRAEG